MCISSRIGLSKVLCTSRFRSIYDGAAELLQANNSAWSFAPAASCIHRLSISPSNYHSLRLAANQGTFHRPALTL